MKVFLQKLTPQKDEHSFYSSSKDSTTVLDVYQRPTTKKDLSENIFTQWNKDLNTYTQGRKQNQIS